MGIFINQNAGTFHLQNEKISYIMKILPNGNMAQLYFGKRIHGRDNYDYLLECCQRSHSAYFGDELKGYSLEHLRQEYPVYGTGDYRMPALEIGQLNGSSICDFAYESYEVMKGKPTLPGLPATYTEAPEEASTLILRLRDPVTNVRLELLYTIFEDGGVIARSSRLINEGEDPVYLRRVMSFSIDLPDKNYEWMQFSGSWARERHLHHHPLEVGIQSVGSLRGHSSHQHNPFIILKRPAADELQGEAMGFSLVYSGNFLAQAEVDTYNMTRISMGIHPTGFTWKLSPGESFQSPEAVIAYSSDGLNHLSQTFHKLYQKRLVRGVWRDQARPILINNWEATYFDFNEEKIINIAKKAKECGVELMVLDDGWFGERRDDWAGLGDWTPAPELLPNGISGLSEKIEELGMKFGLWFEPEMVNQKSLLYMSHPDWILSVPGRTPALCRHQYVLDFSRPEVVDHIFDMMDKLLSESKISYIKWDMNRSITDFYCRSLPADQQGEVLHRYILGVYDLYERLTSRYPEILFESCAGGGGRFDPGLLYYAPQGWLSDDTDAMERLKIQYGSSYCYPISSMGSHVSAVPNHQLKRNTSMKIRAEVACFGTYGYELDLNQLSAEDLYLVKEYTDFMKEHRQLLQFGTFYRLMSPFERNETAWMVVSEDRQHAIVGHYRSLARVNVEFSRLRLQGLDPDAEYIIEKIGNFYGDELMNAGLPVSDGSSGKIGEGTYPEGDFTSHLYIINAR